MASTKTVVKESNAQPSTPARSGNRPFIKVSVKGMIFAVAWKNIVEKEDGTTFTTITTDIYRRYRDEEGNYQTSHNFRERDLPLAQLANQELFRKLMVMSVEVADTEVTE